ncbi:uncharacterized protein A1O5_09062 [Cladophialophora psammophila CBS 110553]|uniref:Uncharacterized protein n=1 Tax=Cladophialophora psammophila CBS 110553 TaxID=1182543 RepID=W9WSS8_9EURO|nr:uncharacterized protein A1O5_09062 [Cladophialophora psammophila CBS 110553]EXJ67716.1 hypothetical protein A1O5_09062 [Cladophialophora psammophila CBS 110553]
MWWSYLLNLFMGIITLITMLHRTARRGDQRRDTVSTALSQHRLERPGLCAVYSSPGAHLQRRYHNACHDQPRGLCFSHEMAGFCSPNGSVRLSEGETFLSMQYTPHPSGLQCSASSTLAQQLRSISSILLPCWLCSAHAWSRSGVFVSSGSEESHCQRRDGV